MRKVQQADGTFKFEVPSTNPFQNPSQAPTSPEKTSKEASTNQLPQDPVEFDKAIAPYRIMVAPIMQGISRLSAMAGTDPLDSEERGSGTLAFSALMYQYGGMLDARVLVLMWMLGVAVPRVIQYFDKRKKEQNSPAKVQAEMKAPQAVAA